MSPGRGRSFAGRPGARPRDDRMHRYTAYGLSIASELALPELVPARNGTAAGPADLVLRLGPTPDRLEGAAASRVLWSARPGAWLHEVPGVARFYVHGDGAEVVVERRGGTDADLRAFLFGTTLGAILHQRGLFALHASAAVLPGGAVAVAGPSGAGKSTTLAALAARGHPVLSDDKTVVRVGDAEPEALSGYPTLRLWADATARLGLDAAGLPALREGVEKVLYAAPVFRAEPAPLRAVVVLVPDVAAGAPAATPLAGHAAVNALLQETYRRRIVTALGLQADHFRWAARLAGAVPVVRLARPAAGDTVAAVADAVEAVVAGTR